jgi:hypothetical protein
MKLHRTGILILTAVLALGASTWAADEPAQTPVKQRTCGDAKSPDMRMFKPLSIDKVTGKISAQSVATGEVVQLRVSPQEIARHKMTVGVPFDVATPSITAEGRCKCGQKSDGSCWCVSDVPQCCGPLHGCPIASCDKKQPIPN